MAEKIKKEIIHANGFDIRIFTTDFENEYLSLTDIAKYKSNDPNDVIKNWMRGRETLEFLGLWEKLHNSDFKPVEFDGVRSEAGLHDFTMSPTKWIGGVNAIGIVSKAGRYGGTYAHSDIALEFASWVSAEFKLYIMKDYQRLKKDENSRLSLNWNLNREIAKLNYKIHTGAIKENLIPPELTMEQMGQEKKEDESAGIEVSDHFAGAGKMIDLPKGAKREVGDIMLTRYACYLIAQNGDPRKEKIAFAQSYFAVQTRKQELITLLTTSHTQFLRFTDIQQRALMSK